MTSKLTLLAGLALAAVTLGACNDSDNDSDNDNDGGGNAAVAPQDQVGGAFSTAFAAGPNDAPIDPQAGDAGTLTLTGDPIDF